jgi:agmatinase
MILTPHQTAFLGPPKGFCDFETAEVVVIPFGYEGGVSYGRGTALAPLDVLTASQQVEFYDEVLDKEPYRIGIATLETPAIPQDPRQMISLLSDLSGEIVDRGKFPIVIGGDHSISSGSVKAMARRYPRFGVLQLDAHADLRNTYLNSPFSHACIMSRVLEMTPYVLQIGVRSMSAEEAQRVREQSLSLCTMRQWRRGEFDFGAALAAMPEQVFITLDVDVLDWSVVSSTGTPEPGGMLWDEVLELLRVVFSRKDVVGCDIVELSHSRDDLNSPFAVAKLIYKMIGFKFAAEL